MRVDNKKIAVLRSLRMIEHSWKMLKDIVYQNTNIIRNIQNMTNTEVMGHTRKNANVLTNNGNVFQRNSVIFQHE